MIRGTFQVADLLSAQKAHLFGKKSTWISMAVTGGTLLFTGWIVFKTPGTLETFAWIWLAFLILVPLQIFLFRRNVRRNYLQRKDLHREAFFEPSDSGLASRTENANAIKPWSDYLKWSESPRVFMLYMSDNLFQVVPKHFFSSNMEVDSFRELLRARIRSAVA
jgi:hypothetical protein